MIDVASLMKNIGSSRRKRTLRMSAPTHEITTTLNTFSNEGAYVQFGGRLIVSVLFLLFCERNYYHMTYIHFEVLDYSRFHQGSNIYIALLGNVIRSKIAFI